MSERILEGTWEEMLKHTDELAGQKVRVTVLKEGNSTTRTPSSEADKGKMITFGMFPQLRDLTEEDFKIAEWHGDDVDL